MNSLQSGDRAPVFDLPRDGGGRIRLGDLKGRSVVIYFYPKDSTPGCTQESCDFRDALPAFETLNTTVIGISRDSVKSHDKFRSAQNLNFPLASDEDGTVCAQYGAWIEKSMYGKKYMGIDRSTFLIDRAGIIRRIWRNVKVKGHVDEVEEALKTLRAAA